MGLAANIISQQQRHTQLLQRGGVLVEVPVGLVGHRDLDVRMAGDLLDDGGGTPRA
jgi:hypothetical protein